MLFSDSSLGFFMVPIQGSWKYNMDFASIEDGGDTIALGLSKKKSILFVNNVLILKSINHL